MNSRRPREEPGSHFRRDTAPRSRVRRADPSEPGTRTNPILRLVGFALVAGAFAWYFFATQQSPVTFGYDRFEFQDEWNQLAEAGGFDQTFTITDVDWTDEEAGVFGFAFSPTMSILGRVDGTPLAEVEELALIGQPDVDGRDLVVAGMELVIAVTEPDLSDEERSAILTDLAVLGTLPADPDQRTEVGDTEFRVAADPQSGVLGIGARPSASSD